VKRFTVNIAHKFGEQLWGREEGKRIRDEIIEEFLLNDYLVLVMDFIGVSRIDFSCASEIVSVLILRISGELKGRHVILANLSSFVEENIDAALEKAELCCIVLEDQSWKLIGKFSETLIQTLQKVSELKSADTPTISDALKIAVPSCNNRLKTLLSLGMIKRNEIIAPSGGKQYMYYSIV
jgi:hypothetical protein